MSDDHIKSEISSYLTGGLTESRSRHVEAHASSCEKCRYAITKARAKQARIKREALKKASHDPLPNLFLARKGKDSGMNVPAQKIPWLLLSVLVLAGAGYKIFRHVHPAVPPAPVAEPEPETFQSSSAAVPSPAASPLAPSAGKAEVPPATPRPPALKPPVVLEVQQEWKGSESGIKEPRSVVIRNKEVWERLWAEMQMKDPLPEVDFSKNIIVGIFGGERPDGSTLVFGKFRQTDEEVYAPYRVSFTPPVPQLSSTTAPVLPGPAHPYLLALIARVETKVRLTQKEAVP